MAIISISDFRNNLKKYTELATSEDVVITKNGKPFVKLTKIPKTKIDILNELAGSVTIEKSYEELMDERYSKYIL